MCLRETKAIIGKAPRLGIHTWKCPRNGQAGADRSLRGIFRENKLTKFADMPCGGCGCVVEGGCMQGCRVGGRIGVRSRRCMERERDCFYYIIEQTYDVGLHSRRQPMEFDSGTRPLASVDAPSS